MHAVRSLPRALAAAVLCCLLGLSVVVLGAPARAAYDTDTIAASANAARAGAGLAPLARNAALDAVALGWAHQLAANGTLSHNPDVASQIPSGWGRVGENVAQGYADGRAMHQGWMGSSGHRANILGDYTDLGVAFVRSGGTTWGVQVFASYPPGSAGAAARTAPSSPAPRRARPTPTRATATQPSRGSATTRAPATGPTPTPSTTTPSTTASPTSPSATPNVPTTAPAAAVAGSRQSGRDIGLFRPGVGVRGAPVTV